MSKFIQYEHHGAKVWTRMALKGKHREHCLCHSCERLDIATPEHNCFIAKELYHLCIKFDITTPVFECKYFEKEKLPS